MELRRPDEHYTTADYEQWEGDWELWFGQPVAMSPSPAERHGELLVELAYQIKASLKANPRCRCRVMAEVDWRVSLDTVVRPDLSVLCDADEPRAHINRPPTLIAEILSPATAKRDRTSKHDLYASQGVTHYLLVDQDSGAVEALLREGEAYAPQHPAADAFDLELHAGCRIRIPAVLSV